MARYAYCKVYCDLLRHPILRSRPDCDVRLALGLLLFAKEHGGPQGNVAGLGGPEEARGLFGIKAPIGQVREGWDHLLAEGWLVALDDGGLIIRDFGERQGKNDSLEAKAERQRAYYDRNKDLVLVRQRAARLVRAGKAEEAKELLAQLRDGG